MSERDVFPLEIAAVFKLEIATAVEICEDARRAGLLLGYKSDDLKLHVRIPHANPSHPPAFSGTPDACWAWIKAWAARGPTLGGPALPRLEVIEPIRELTRGLLDGLVITPLVKDGAITHLHLTVRDLPGLRIVLDVGAAEEIRDSFAMVLGPGAEVNPMTPSQLGRDGFTPNDRALDDTVRAEWAACVAEFPPRVREVAARFNPWTIYRVMSTEQICRVIGFHEGALSCGETPCGESCARPKGHDGDHHPDGDVTVWIYAEHPALGVISGTKVFGIEPEGLKPLSEVGLAKPGGAQ